MFIVIDSNKFPRFEDSYKKLKGELYSTMLHEQIHAASWINYWNKVFYPFVKNYESIRFDTESECLKIKEIIMALYNVMYYSRKVDAENFHKKIGEPYKDLHQWTDLLTYARNELDKNLN